MRPWLVAVALACVVGVLWLIRHPATPRQTPPLATIRLIGVPPGARVCDPANQELGRTPGAILLPPGVQALVIHPGDEFEDIQLAIVLSPEELARRSAKRLVPSLHRKATTTVVSTHPAEAEVFVDGTSRGKGRVELQVPAGQSVVVEARLACYRSQTKSIRADSAMTTEISLILQPDEVPVRVTSDPTQATVSAAEGRVGETPWEGKALPGTTIAYILSLHGYKSQQVSGQASPCSPLSLFAKLVPEDVTVHVTSEPAGALVTSAGQVLGQTPWKGSVLPGTKVSYHLTLKGYRPRKVGGEATPAQPLVLRAKLAPIPPQDLARKESALTQGDSAYEYYDYLGALDPYLEARRLDPGDAAVWRRIALCHFRLGHAELAASDLAMAAGLKPDETAIATTRSYLRTATGDAKQTADLAQKAVRSRSVRDDEPGFRRGSSTLEGWIDKANGGDARSQFELGKLFSKGSAIEGVQKDPGGAALWLKKAAAQGDPEIINALGVVTAQADDPVGAQKYFKMALQADSHSVKAEYNLAQLHLAAGIKEKKAQELKDALDLFQKAAETLDDAQTNLATMYMEGLGMDRPDPKKAVEWYLRAAGNATKGNLRAQYFLGLAYMEGKGVDQDSTQAKHWLGLSAAQGFEPAKQLLSKLK